MLAFRSSCNFWQRLKIKSSGIFIFNTCKVKKYSSLSNSRFAKMELSAVVKKLDSYADKQLAEDWDNVGLLIEPTTPQLITKILLTIDLTVKVLEEAIQEEAELIISYHPPIFRPIKNLQNNGWKNFVALKCIEQRIAVYSPHTSLDAKQNGLNDWLIHCFDCQMVTVIKGNKMKGPRMTHGLKVQCPAEYEEHLRKLFPNVGITNYSTVPSESVNLYLEASNDDYDRIISTLTGFEKFVLIPDSQFIPKQEAFNTGGGRLGLLSQPIKLLKAVRKVKSHLDLETVRISIAKDHSFDSEVQTVAVCAGSGAELLRDVKADLILTGEMSHHDLLDAAHRGCTVILTEHSNSERGFLKPMCADLYKCLPGVNLMISKTDGDPVQFV